MDCLSILQRWRKWIRFVVVVVYILLLVIAIPLCIWELKRKGAQGQVLAWFVGGIFVLMALPISLWGILQHIINYTTPHLQRHIIRILWMVPVYALNAWFALRFSEAAIYLDTLRECYEAYVIYNFMAYLLSFINHEYPHLDIENKPPVQHIFPLCLLPACRSSPKFIQKCKHGVLQYTVVRPAMTVLALVCELFNKYEEGDFNFKSSWSYIVIINNMSQILAMYCLVLFYKAFKEELQPLKPVPKFLCVKAVVFLSFWQALLIAALAKLNVIPQNSPFLSYKDIKEVSTSLQDFLICIEMFVAAIAHYFSFSHKPFVNLAAEQQNWLSSFLSMWDVRDVAQDVVEHARYIGRGMHKTLSRGKRLMKTESNERTPLLAGGDIQVSGTNAHSGFSVRNVQNKAPPTPAIIVECDVEETLLHRSTTASMNNFVDLDEPEMNESRHNLSRSVSLKGYDSSEDEMVETARPLHDQKNELFQVKIIMDQNNIHIPKNNFENLDIQKFDKGEDSTFNSRNTEDNNPGKDSDHSVDLLQEDKCSSE